MPVAASSTTNLWDSAKADLRTLFPEDVFKLWFDPVVCLEASAERLTLGVPTDFAAIWINDNYMDLILQRLRLTAGREIKVTLRKSDTSASSSTLGSTDTEPSRPRATAPRRTARPVEERAPRHSALSARNTFENFVVGSNNQMAAAAARAVADAPGQSYNPLFLYGDTGLGKTHLMHAIGHAILARRPDARIAYISAETFTNDFIQAIQENALTKFRQRYRHVDVLLISTTSSSSPAKSAPRRSSSTPSTTSTAPANRSSSPATAAPPKSKNSKPASSPASSGDSPPTSSPPTSRPASPSSAPRRPP